MKRAKQITAVSNRAVVETGITPFAMVPLPPDPWYVRGPRGGLYVATGSRQRVEDLIENDAFIRNLTNVIDLSEGVRYLRPGSRAYRAAIASESHRESHATHGPAPSEGE